MEGISEIYLPLEKIEKHFLSLEYYYYYSSRERYVSQRHAWWRKQSYKSSHKMFEIKAGYYLDVAA